MLRYYVAATAGVVLTAVSQSFFKLGADRTARRGVFYTYANPFSIAAYTMLLGVTLLNLYAYRVLPLKLSVTFLPFTYILVGLFSFTFHKEKMTRGQLAGVAVILIGIVIYNLDLG